MQQELMNAIMSGLGTVLIALVGVITRKAIVYLNEKGITEKLKSKEYLAKWAVSGVEQIYQNEKGPEKFALAKEEFLSLLHKNGLEVNEEEVDLLLEAMVNAMNQGIQEEKEKHSKSLNAPEIKGVVSDVSSKQ